MVVNAENEVVGLILLRKITIPLHYTAGWVFVIVTCLSQKLVSVIRQFSSEFNFQQKVMGLNCEAHW